MNAWSRTIRSGPRRAAFTLAELLLALATTALIATSVAAMSVALANAAESSQNLQLRMQEARMTVRRIEDCTRKARLVTACDGQNLALWMEDANNDGRINIEEIGLVRWDRASRQVRLDRIVYPNNWSQWIRSLVNYTIDLSVLVSVNTTAGYISGSYYTQSTLLAEDVSVFVVRASPSPPATNLVSVQLTIGDGESAIELRTATQIRADKTASVFTADGAYYLLDP